MTPLRMAYLSALVAGVGFFALSVAWLGIWPARVLEEQARAFGPATTVALTESELRGRAIYAREGCAYCHTQQVRFTEADQARFGAPTLAWESRRDYPHMLGTRRIGPDLSRGSGTRAADWQLAHLYAPRAIAADSVMPAYRHLFKGSASEPTQDARDLVAYLDSLGRARALASSDPSVHPASTRRTGDVPAIPEDGDAVLGAQLYQANCAGCHGLEGNGDGPSADALRPRPSVLASHDYTPARLAEALWRGVPGTSMPAWRDRSTADLAALSAYVRNFSGRTAVESAEVTDAQRAVGAGVYAANCAQCHGVAGAGDGWAGSLLDVRPTNFQAQRPSHLLAMQVLERGIEGTLMASWTSRLTMDERAGVAAFIRTFYKGSR